jgi:hypothetical protein
MALSTANTNAAESHLHCSTFASRYVRTALPRYPSCSLFARRRPAGRLIDWRPESPGFFF